MLKSIWIFSVWVITRNATRCKYNCFIISAMVILRFISTNPSRQATLVRRKFRPNQCNGNLGSAVEIATSIKEHISISCWHLYVYVCASVRVEVGRGTPRADMVVGGEGRPLRLKGKSTHPLPRRSGAEWYSRVHIVTQFHLPTQGLKLCRD